MCGDSYDNGMTNHPIHLHGHEFHVTGTDGGPTPKATRWYEVTTDVAVGQMRQIEFLADEEGDWAFHCHKSHHTMNAMGHDIANLIGVDHRGLAGTINNPVSVQTRSLARISYESYLEKFNKAKSYKEDILPTQKKISEENLLRYNGMLIDVFHLLEDAEKQSKTVIEYIDANLALLIQAAKLEKDLIDAQMDFSNINVR